MPRSKSSSSSPGEKERLEVLLEEIRGDVKQIKEGYVQLEQKMDAGFSQLRSDMNQRFAIVEQAIKENSGAIRKNSEDIRQLQMTVGKLSQDVHGLTERFEVHQKEHAT